ncbi:DNA replication protein DnaC [Alicyclobacillus cycloheptanicus]|uniref:DNA replication protein DnaC n=1 Tax=Alicyclobacillus cycloheptanicus TaxID=1457 RepID=A0ABT9XDJ8_9BACL|nr:DNA replication protein DnaC [Alicyclobacillus cycloheptanicus]
MELIHARYERGSIILTSNKGIGEWNELFGDAVPAAAVLDSLLHHAHILNIRGQSYRLKDKMKDPALTREHRDSPRDRRLHFMAEFGR